MDDKSIDTLIKQLDSLCQKDFQLKCITVVLKDLTYLMKSDNYRCTLTSNNWNSVINTTQIIKKILLKTSFETGELDALAEFFRFLRNSCGGGIVENQKFILGSSDIVHCIRQTINFFKDKQEEKERVVLKCCIQLLGNLVCLSQDAKVWVWSHFLEHKLFQQLFKHEDHVVREYSLMVLYNCMSNDMARFLIGTTDGHHILTSLFDSLCNDLVDWGILFLECILKQENFFQNCYAILPIHSRLLILDFVTQHLSTGMQNQYLFVPYSSISFIKELFIEYVMDIVQICNNEQPDLKPVEIVKVLCLLCHASATDIYCDVLRSSQSLLETSLDTLKSVHLLGKKGPNAFSCISSLKASSQLEKEEIEGNPSYGFKKNLIRLIGNLCYNCRENQDAVRKLEGIPLLLDCCNLDARNPFIMQWCILAIRNIMEKNAENQAILAGVTVTGDLVNSALIKELGFEVHSENGKHILRTLQPFN